MAPHGSQNKTQTHCGIKGLNALAPPVSCITGYYWLLNQTTAAVINCMLRLFIGLNMFIYLFIFFFLLRLFKALNTY